MVTDAQKRATAKYEKENYDKVLTRFPKGTKDRITATGSSVNAFIIKAVLDALDREEQQKTEDSPENPEKIKVPFMD